MDNTQQVRLIAKTRIRTPHGGTVDAGEVFYHEASHAQALIDADEAALAPDPAADRVELFAATRLSIPGRPVVEVGERFTADAATAHALLLAGEAEPVEVTP